MRKPLIFILLLTLFFSGCNKENILETNSKMTGTLNISLDKNNVPSDIVGVNVLLTKENYESKEYQLNLIDEQSAEILINDLSIGTWHLIISAYNNNNVILYSGKTDVNIVYGQTTPVALVLNPTSDNTGALELIVSWNNMTWADYVNNPILSITNDKYKNAMHPFIIEANGKHFMYFTGHSGEGSEIYLAISLDGGLTWANLKETPVLLKGKNGNWDSRNVSVGAVIKKAGHFLMYYNGRSSNEVSSTPWYIGLATSLDGITWEKHPTPVLSGSNNSWDLKIAASDVEFINNQYYMYYSGKNELGDHKIGMATSQDGINWTKHKQNPILEPEFSWENTGIYKASIIKDNDSYKMVYQNTYTYSISAFGMAKSIDGLNWVKEKNNPIFTEEQTRNKYSKILYPNFQKINNEFRIYYTGYNNVDNNYSINLIRKQ